MDVSSLTWEELQRLPLEQLREAWPQLTPDQRNAALEALDPAFRLTPDEARRRDSAWTLADPATWRATAASCIVHVVESYGRGEFDMLGAVNAMHLAAIGCWAQDRVQLIGLMAAEARRRRGPGRRRSGCCEYFGTSRQIRSHALSRWRPDGCAFQSDRGITPAAEARLPATTLWRWDRRPRSQTPIPAGHSGEGRR
jgi:hypothetical protein